VTTVKESDPKFVAQPDLISHAYFEEPTSTVSMCLKKGRINDPEATQRIITISREDVSKTRSLIPDDVPEMTKNVSQLGLKELWLGGDPKKHNRWRHSQGVFNAGVIWLSVLQEANRVPKRASCFPTPLRTWNDVLSTVGPALLMHDYGHLPFSHLFDEVLKWMHWVPDSYSEWGSEAAVLRRRFDKMEGTWRKATELLGPSFPLTPAELRNAIEQLILGRYATPWLQTIVNSPIDADKIDYIRFDSEFLRDCDFGIGQRLQLSLPRQWLADFLQEQEVNHAGLLCLHGRSAKAAADLWRERMVMYDRFYLSPDLRVPERMAFEIVQQFLIRTTMSQPFARQWNRASNSGFPDSIKDSDNILGDSITAKYTIACSVIQNMHAGHESDVLEFSTLENMNLALQGCCGLDQGYKDFLAQCFEVLRTLKTKRRKLRDVVSNCLVREPITFPRAQYRKAQDIIRPLQHTYCRETLIDLVQMPRVLSGPRARYTGVMGQGRAFECQIVVPDGPVDRWGVGMQASTPLSDVCVTNLEIPICRVIVISPEGGRRSRAQYVWERVRSALLDCGISVNQEAQP
jgi:hypothetical protein